MRVISGLYICQKHDYIHGNYYSPYTGNHPECHLEFLKVFNGNEMTSIGVLNVNKNATKLFGLRNSLVLKSPLFNNVIFLNSGGHLGCSPHIVCFLALISMYNCFIFQIQVISYLKVPQNMIISMETTVFCIRAAILDAILNFSNCSVVTRCHPPDS